MPKPYLPYGKQIQKLINDKRLIIKDVNFAERMLDAPFYLYLRKPGILVLGCHNCYSVGG